MGVNRIEDRDNGDESLGEKTVRRLEQLSEKMRKGEPIRCTLVRITESGEITFQKETLIFGGRG